MKVACPSCRALFEIDASVAAGPGLPLCEACSDAGLAPPPPPQMRRPRPKMPSIDLGKRKAKREGAEGTEGTGGAGAAEVEPVSFDDLDVTSAPRSNEAAEGTSAEGTSAEGASAEGASAEGASAADPGPPSRAGAGLPLGEPAGDVDPVSLRDLGVVLGPAAAPPAWSGAPRVRPDAEPRAASRDGDSSGLVDIRRLAANAASRDQQVKAKPSYFSVDLTEPAPSDDIPVFTEEEPPPPSSEGRADLRSLLGTPSDRPSRTTADFLNLSSGLFADTRPQAPIDLTPLEDAPVTSSIAPVLRLDRSPPSVRPPAPPRDSAPPEELPTPPHALKSSVPGPVVAERRPQKRSSVIGWMAAVIATASLTGFVAARLSTPREPARSDSAVEKPPVAVETRPANDRRDDTLPTAAPAPPPPATVATTRPAETARPVETARPADAARRADPSRAADPARPSQPVPAPVTPATPPDLPTPAAARPPAPQPAPQAAPPSGGEFDRAAAKAALASAASAAAGCKDADDPSGGARVSVTFAPSGRVTTSKLLGPPFAGTKTGSCIARAFRSISVPSFSGDPVTITKDVSVR